MSSGIGSDDHHRESRNTSKDGNSQGNEKVHIVFINGFLIPSGWISMPPHHIPDDFNVINVFPSSVGSVHDRICELFYELVGGRVDYGEDHSLFHGHNRYGRVFQQGLLPQWDEDHPIVVVGHSLGGLTANALQTYLAQKRFASHPHTNHRWVKGVVTISSPFNGTLKVYPLGMNPSFNTIVRWGSWGYQLALWIHLSEFINKDWVRRNIVDFNQRK